VDATRFCLNQGCLAHLPGKVPHLRHGYLQFLLLSHSSMKKIWIPLFAAAAAAMGQSVQTGISMTSGTVRWGSSQVCGPPGYFCSRTDLAVASNPPVPPQVGGNICTAGSLTACGNLAGANTVVIDPDFHSRIVRITDANSNPDHVNFIYSAGIGGSGDVNVWNNDSTLFLVNDEGGNYYPFSFNPASMQAGPLYGTSPDMFRSGAGVFSRTNSNYFYSFGGNTTTTVRLYDFTDRVNRPTPSTVFDFTNCGISDVTLRSK
jgi:hypothetical protein